MVEQLEFNFNVNKKRLLTFSDAKKCYCGSDPHVGNSPLHDTWRIHCSDFKNHSRIGVHQKMEWNHENESVDKLVRNWNSLVDMKSKNKVVPSSIG